MRLELAQHCRHQGRVVVAVVVAIVVVVVIVIFNMTLELASLSSSMFKAAALSIAKPNDPTHTIIVAS